MYRRGALRKLAMSPMPRHIGVGLVGACLGATFAKSPLGLCMKARNGQTEECSATKPHVTFGVFEIISL
ncbi:Uncharacterized protein TCM_014676 [Theobroma cacao]|uniref:Uncharacterized protein n=1 Tax=Theobroma cacao TaxID=3641 RepID=A0A061FYB7_THECC|nr:Uncharacterized protein TCM_014676 [Theobroma cacao]